MRKYPKEFKSNVIARMLPPNNADVPALARETGIPRDTLYAWRLMARGKTDETKGGQILSSEDKFNIVLETASMNEEELSAYCRRKGLFPDQILTWKHQCERANDPYPKRVDREKVKQYEQETKKLKSELKRKEKALAEAAALLVLKKKVQEIWGDPEED